MPRIIVIKITITKVVGLPGITLRRACSGHNRWSARIPGIPASRIMWTGAWARYRWIRPAAYKGITMGLHQGHPKARYWWTPPNPLRSQTKNACYCRVWPRLMAASESQLQFRRNNNIHRQVSWRKTQPMWSPQSLVVCQLRKANLKSTLGEEKGWSLQHIIRPLLTLILKKISRVMGMMILK